MKTLGLIPARGGSVRLPGKNIIDLGGKPLLAWTIQVARKSGVISRLVCSTDDDKIAQIAEAYGIDQVVQRPQELAQSETPMLAVALHAIERVAYHFDFIMLLQPTSPFRTVACMREASDRVLRHWSVITTRGGMKPNGAVYAMQVDRLWSAKEFYDTASDRIPMSWQNSMDIDTLADLQMAREMLSTGMMAGLLSA